MASLQKIASYHLDTIRNGIGWIVIYKVGRSWNSEEIWLDDADSKLEPHQMDIVNLALNKDKNAVILNGYYCGHFGEDMDIIECQDGIRWHYENGHNLLSDFIESH
jgi:hypothetical protein